MDAFTTHKALAAVYDRPNVDTDLIIPKQFLTHIERVGFGRFLFHNVRFLEDGMENPDFFLNKDRFRQAGILVSGENFGCGSSREHAPWALHDYGFRVVIAQSFGDIFRNNSFKIGLLLIELKEGELKNLAERIEKTPGYQISVDLKAQTVKGDDGFLARFEIDSYRKERLLNGWDDIGMTLALEEKIKAYEKAHQNSWQAALPS